MKRPGGRHRDHQWILDYKMPGPAPERRAIRPEEDDEDELAGEEPAAADPPQEPIVEQLLAASEPDPGGEAGVVLVRCLGEEVVAMDRLAAGDRARPLSGVELEVAVGSAGRCRIGLAEPEVTLQLLDPAGGVRTVGTEEARQLLLEPPRRALVTFGDQRLLVRPVTGAPPRRRGALWLGAVVLLVAAAILGLWWFLGTSP